MFTKNEFAHYLVQTFRSENEERTANVADSELEQFIYSSTSLGIALQQLGLIKNQQSNDYLNERGGILFLLIDQNVPEKSKTFSIRELMSLLPDEISIEYDENGCQHTKHVFHNSVK